MKIAMVGAVGSATAYAALIRGVAREIVIHDQSTAGAQRLLEE